ncbi:MAG: GTPase HflX [Candidatus Omnitrophota bacterium]
MWETQRDKKENAILVTVQLTGQDSWLTQDYARELKVLAQSSGVKVAAEILAHRDRPTPGYFIGSGKAQELALLCQEKGAACVIFNEDLSATQQRNLEDIIQVKVIDRTQLILDIFAQRAKSMEGKIQVELAQLEYLLPRLTGKGILLSRLGGGIGTRGPGEKKLEVDRRRIKARISSLKKELLSLSQRRTSLRAHRRRGELSTVAIIGYTNAGKSTLMNSLTGSQQVVKDSLFTTLDPLARKYTLANRQQVLFSDTVGFIRQLPHHLIEAFKATLEEVQQADVLLHVLDASSVDIYEHNAAVHIVLQALQADDKPIVVALNKIDLLTDEDSLKCYLKDFPQSVAVSALKNQHLDQLLDQIIRQLTAVMIEVKLQLPSEQMHLVNLIHAQGQVLEQLYQKEGIYIHARIPVRLKSQLESFLQKKN